VKEARIKEARVKEAGVTVAVVTGAGGSLGRAIARRLAADGHVVAVTDVDGQGLDETRVAVEKEGGQAHAWPVDLRDAAAIAGFFDAVAAGPGRWPSRSTTRRSTRPRRSWTSGRQYDDVQAVNQRATGSARVRPADAGHGRGRDRQHRSITMHGGWANLALRRDQRGAAAALTRGPGRARAVRHPVNAVSPARSRPRPSRSTMTRQRTTSTSWISSR
jgi:hypothetical protein